MKEVKDKLIVVTKWMEIAIAVLLIIAIIICGLHIMIRAVYNFQDGIFQLDAFLQTMLTLVVGIEFAKMLILHTPESVLEVLLYAVARQIVIYHDSALENLIGVLAVGVIFVIRHYFVKQKQIQVDNIEAK